MSHKSFIKNAANEEQIKESEARVKFGKDLEIDDLKQLLATPFGRRFYWRYLGLTGIYKSSVEPSGSYTYFNEGKRDIGLKLLAELTEHAPERYLQMMNESKGDLPNV